MRIFFFWNCYSICIVLFSFYRIMRVCFAVVIRVYTKCSYWFNGIRWQLLIYKLKLWCILILMSVIHFSGWSVFISTYTCEPCLEKNFSYWVFELFTAVGVFVRRNRREVLTPAHLWHHLNLTKMRPMSQPERCHFFSPTDIGSQFRNWGDVVLYR